MQFEVFVVDEQARGRVRSLDKLAYHLARGDALCRWGADDTCPVGERLEVTICDACMQIGQRRDHVPDNERDLALLVFVLVQDRRGVLFGDNLAALAHNWGKSVVEGVTEDRCFEHRDTGVFARP